VSVVIPTFNCCEDVLVAVRSAVEQTWPADRLEIIVVDDGGNDETGDAIDAAFRGRVRYLWKPHGGVSATRNLGVEASRGKYIAFLDADDEFRPTKIAKQVALLESNEDLVMALTDVERMNGDRVTTEIWRRRSQLPHDGFVLPHVLTNPSLVPSSAMIERHAYDHLEGFDEKLISAEDIDLHLRLALDWGIGLVPEPLTRWMRAGDDGQPRRARTYHEYGRVIERFVAAHQDVIGRYACDQALIAAYDRSTRGFVETGELGAALRSGIKGVAVRARRAVVGR
jgi:glycosyltransferase involved in cell wall biosynthesis